MSPCAGPLRGAPRPPESPALLVSQPEGAGPLPTGRTRGGAGPSLPPGDFVSPRLVHISGWPLGVRAGGGQGGLVLAVTLTSCEGSSMVSASPPSRPPLAPLACGTARPEQ